MLRTLLDSCRWLQTEGIGKSAPNTSEQTEPPQGGTQQKSFPRKVPKLTVYVHVPKTDTGGLV
jgi:hypothetical protein